MKIIRRLIKQYVSDVDKFLQRYRETHSLSKSQLRELKKHESIFQKRDHAKVEPSSSIWKEF